MELRPLPIDHNFLRLDPDLAVWLRMDDVDGSGNPVDSGSAGNTWTITNQAAQANAGVIGKSFVFDGASDYVSDATPAGLPLGATSRTFCMWIKTNAVTNNPANLGAFAGTGNQRWLMRIKDGKLHLLLGTPTKTGTNATLNDGRWHHVAITLDSNDGNNITHTKFYVDGQLDSASAETAGVVDTVLNRCFLGSGNGGSSGYNGQIDDFRIYTRNLTATEILEIYELGTLDAMTAFDAAYFKEYLASRSGFFNRTFAIDSEVFNDLTIGNDLLVNGSLAIDNITGTDAVLTMDGTSNWPMTFTYESDDEVLILNKRVWIDSLSLQVTGDLRVDTDLLVADSFTGKVGIRTASPDHALHIAGENTRLHLQSTNNAVLEINRGSASFWNQIEFQTVGSRKWAVGLADSDLLGDGTEFFIGQFGGGQNATIIITTNNNVGIVEVAPETLLEMTSTVPYLTLHNSTVENSDGGRESRINFKGHQTTASAESTLARIEVSHDGTGDDEKGKIVFSVNDGNDGDTPTDVITFSANGNVFIGTTSDMLAPLNITGDTADIGDRHEGLWMRSKEGAWIVQVNVRGPRLEIGGGATLDATPAMSVNYNTGRVGIGTTTPGYILDIDAGEIGDGNYDGLRIVDTGWKAVSHPMLEFYNSHEDFNGSLARIYGEIGNVGTNSKLYFAVADSSKNLQDRMVIDKSGSVGINTTTPDAKLQVVGDMHVGDDATNQTQISATGVQSQIAAGGAITQTFTGIKTLTDNTAIGFVEIAIESGGCFGGSLNYTICVDDDTDLQSHSGEAAFVAVNLSGTVTSDIEEQYLPPDEAEITTGGSTLTDDFAITNGDGSPGKITITCDVDSSLNVGAVLRYTIELHSTNTITAL